MQHLGDITKINGAEIPIVDVITGGSPCQDLSVAGQRAGLAGERSGLFMEQIRIVKEMREHDRRANNRTGQFVRPRYMVWENVAGAFSSGKPKGADFQAVLTEIARVSDPECSNVPLPNKGWSKSGCIYDELGRFSIAWVLHDAQWWGVPQRRKRIALVADFNGLSAPQILFNYQYHGEADRTDADPSFGSARTVGGREVSVISESMQRDIESGEQEREETPGDSGAGTQAASYTLKVRGGVERDSTGRKAGKGALIQTELSGTLGVSQDQTLFAIEGNGSRDSHYGDGYKETDKMYTLNTVEQHAVSYGVVTKGNGDVFINKDTHTSLSSGGGQAGQGYPCVITEKQTEPLCIGNGQENEASRPEKVSKPLNCLSDKMKVLCVGNGQLAQAKLSEKVGALNCMHDQQAVLAFDRAAYNQGKNAKYDFSVEEDVAQTVVAKGPGGVCTEKK